MYSVLRHLFCAPFTLSQRDFQAKRTGEESLLRATRHLQAQEPAADAQTLDRRDRAAGHLQRARAHAAAGEWEEAIAAARAGLAIPHAGDADNAVWSELQQLLDQAEAASGSSVGVFIAINVVLGLGVWVIVYKTRVRERMQVSPYAVGDAEAGKSKGAGGGAPEPPGKQLRADAATKVIVHRIRNELQTRLAVSAATVRLGPRLLPRL